MSHRHPFRGPTPGFVLLHDYMVPLCLTPSQLADEIDASPADVNAVLDGQDASDALCDRLARYFGTPADFWHGMRQRVSA